MHAGRMDEHIPGLQVAIGLEGDVAWEGGFGFADLGSHQPMTADTINRSGSMGKVFTASAVMQLVDRGVVSLEDEVGTLVGFDVRNPLDGRAITLHHLLTHQSGLTRNGAGCTFADPLPLREYVEKSFAEPTNDHYFGGLPKWSRPVEAAAEYSNTGMALLGLVVESANPSGATYRQWVEHEVCEPLGLHSTEYPEVQREPFVDADLWRRTSTGYAGFGGINVRTPPIHFAEYPAGNALTTAGDLCRLLLAHLRPDGDSSGWLSADAIRSMQSPRTSGRAHKGFDFGLMWMLHTPGNARFDRVFGPHPFLHHGGAHMYGWSGALFGFLDSGVAVVFMTNGWPLVEPDAGMPFPYSLPMLVDGLTDDPAKPDSGRGWAWKTSYLAGLLLAERTVGLMSVREAFDAEMVRYCIDGTHASAAFADRWEPDGFRAGVAAIEAVGHTHAALTDFMRSDGPALSRAEMDLAFAELGGTGRVQIPVSADA